MSDIFNFADTWNNAGTVFSSITLDVTDTASNAASKLIDLKVGTITKFNVNKSGDGAFVGSLACALISSAGTPVWAIASGAGGVSGYQASGTLGFGWGATTAFETPDAGIYRDAAGCIAARIGVTAQAFRVYNTFTDASNYERTALDWKTTANTLTFGTQKLGTGAIRAISIVTGDTAALSITTGQGVLAVSPTGGLGYGTGAGGAVTQITSRTTGVTLNKVAGAITLFSAAGMATWASFTVTNSAVAATDTIVLSVKSGTNKYLYSVTAVAAGSFEISFATTSGVAVDAPVFNFAVIKAIAA